MRQKSFQGIVPLSQIYKLHEQICLLLQNAHNVGFFLFHLSFLSVSSSVSLSFLSSATLFSVPQPVCLYSRHLVCLSIPMSATLSVCRSACLPFLLSATLHFCMSAL